jgi:hypothetical protein
MERKQLDRIIETLSSFKPISLKEMKGVVLMSRVDTKYICEAHLLPEILQKSVPFYNCLEINNKHYASYKTDYLDTKNLDLHTAHQNGKRNRCKIRYREYVDSKLSFLEVKFKNNKGKTVKSRIKSWFDADQISEEDNSFLQAHTPYSRDLINRMLTNNFNRITLVSKKEKERLTIDFSLTYSDNNHQKSLSNLVVIEVKQEKRNRDARIMKILKDKHVYERSFSKYTIGISLLYPEAKYNRFKENLLYLNKIVKVGSIWDSNN